MTAPEYVIYNPPGDDIYLLSGRDIILVSKCRGLSVESRVTLEEHVDSVEFILMDDRIILGEL